MNCDPQTLYINFKDRRDSERNSQRNGVFLKEMRQQPENTDGKNRHCRSPPRGSGEQGNKAIYLSGTREQKSRTEGNRETKAILGTGNIENQDFDFGEREKMPFFRGTREQVPTPPPLGGPHCSQTDQFSETHQEI